MRIQNEENHVEDTGQFLTFHSKWNLLNKKKIFLCLVINDWKLDKVIGQFYSKQLTHMKDIFGKGPVQGKDLMIMLSSCWKYATANYHNIGMGSRFHI